MGAESFEEGEADGVAREEPPRFTAGTARVGAEAAGPPLDGGFPLATGALLEGEEGPPLDGGFPLATGAELTALDPARG